GGGGQGEGGGGAKVIVAEVEGSQAGQVRRGGQGGHETLHLRKGNLPYGGKAEQLVGVVQEDAGSDGDALGESTAEGAVGGPASQRASPGVAVLGPQVALTGLEGGAAFIAGGEVRPVGPHPDEVAAGVCGLLDPA